METSLEKKHGLIVLDKPLGMSSREAVDRILTGLIPGTRLGHAGTLDPLATGVLVLTVGVATRLVEYIQRMPKTYQANLHLGATSETDDGEGPILPVPNARVPSPEALALALEPFRGTISQVPPAFSAAHVGGRRAYHWARKGKNVQLEPRLVRIDAIRVLRFDYPHLDLEIHCGKGTYIRSLARDLGLKLGCGAYLTGLRRTQIGPFTLKESQSLESAALMPACLPLEWAVRELPRVVYPPDLLLGTRQGKKYPLPGMEAAEVAVLDEAGNLRAILQKKGNVYGPAKVFVY